MADNRRKHSKITTELPPEIVSEVNRLLVEEGKTYQEIAGWLKEMGHDVSKSSVGRYGKDFLSRLERLRVVKDQARAIVEENGDRPATELHEAANQIAVQLIMEKLTTVNDLEVDNIADLFKAVAQLERSATGRERLKFNFNKGADAAAEKIKAALKAEISADQDLLSRLGELVDQQVEALKK